MFALDTHRSTRERAKAQRKTGRSNALHAIHAVLSIYTSGTVGGLIAQPGSSLPYSLYMDGGKNVASDEEIERRAQKLERWKGARLRWWST